MSLDIVNIRRKSFDAVTVRVTPLNIEEVAKWCGGTIQHDGEKEGNYSRDYIKVPVASPFNKRQTEAHVGDWVVQQRRSFKSFQNQAARAIFENRDGTPLGVGDEVPGSAKPASNKGPKPGPYRGPRPVQVILDEVEMVDEVLVGMPPVNNEAEVVDPALVEREKYANALVDMTLAGANPEELNKVIAESMPVLRPITLDELNDQVGDPRTAEEIMSEPAPVKLAPLDEATPGEVFRGDR